MKMNIRIAKPTEFERIRSFYHKVIVLMQGAEYKPAWEKGVYPSDAYLMESVENGELWVGEYGSEYAAAMIVNHKCNEEYKSAEWSADAGENEFIIVHALCVLPTLQGKGIASAMQMFYEDTGWTAFKLFEYINRKLKKQEVKRNGI